MNLVGTFQEQHMAATLDNDGFRIGDVVHMGMKNHAGVASRMFDLLSREGINIQMISTSEIKVSCVIDDKYTELAVRALHEGFELGKEPARAETF